MAEVNEAKREKSQVEDINRSLYDFRYEEKDAYKVDAGLTPAIVEPVSYTHLTLPTICSV